MERPPCWPDGQPCPNACAGALYERLVYNRHHLPDPWHGWRFAGRVLVSPDGDRIAAGRLRGLLWRESLEKRVCRGAVSSGRIVPIHNRQDRR